MTHYYIADREVIIPGSKGSALVRGSGTLVIRKGGSLVVDYPVTTEGLREVTHAELERHRSQRNA